ncbi:MAG: (5-formylfuran-3-yl)methyl phosphate synthase [Candidatus Thorarchaeota archaeon]|jgi:uncharacterized protein (UPF0264 family)
MTKLLVTPTDEMDAVDAVNGGADIIDVKNPAEGSLGAALPSLIRKIRSAVSPDIPVSAALGDIPFLPGTVAQAALGAAMAGADYVKIGLHGTKSNEEALLVMKSVKTTILDFKPDVQVVAATYGDYKRVGTLNPNVLPEIAATAEIDIMMVDTAVKDGKSLFEFMSSNEVQELIDNSRSSGLKAALAGSLVGETYKRAVDLRPDIVGVRGAALIGGDRTSGRVDSKLVAELKRIIG